MTRSPNDQMTRSIDRVQVYRQVREIAQRARRQEIVDERQRRLQSARERRVVSGAEKRIQPHEPVTASLQTRDLIAELRRIPAIPSVRDQEHHRPAMQHAATPTLVEFAN